MTELVDIGWTATKVVMIPMFSRAICQKYCPELGLHGVRQQPGQYLATIQVDDTATLHLQRVNNGILVIHFLQNIFNYPYSRQSRAIGMGVLGEIACKINTTLGYS